MTSLREMMRKAVQAQLDRRAEEIERRMMEIMGTGQDLVMWERQVTDARDGLKISTEVAFLAVPAGVVPSEAPQGFERWQGTVYHVSQVKVGKA